MSKKTKKKAMAAVKQILLILMTLVMFFPLLVNFYGVVINHTSRPIG